MASLICNQASFVVLDALAEAMADLVAPFAPEVIVGVPTLGLPLAEGVARRLGHERMVALGTSRKFWYRDEFSEPISSITSPAQAKRLFSRSAHAAGPCRQARGRHRRRRQLGRSMAATLRLLRKAEIEPVSVAVAMLQGRNWRNVLAAADTSWPGLIQGVIVSPLLRRTAAGWISDR